MKKLLFLAVGLTCCPSSADSATVLVEAESFRERGGWVVDQQAMDIMGSPYLLAHGLGVPVADAVTTVTVPAPGSYRIWVRTMDWVARWKAPGAPGKFLVFINGKPLGETFGTRGAEWAWHDGGAADLTGREATIALRDLTGFEGRCDAILLTTAQGFVPPNKDPEIGLLRRKLLGLPDRPQDAGTFDLAVAGGGIAGTCAALAAARLGLRVALIQDRPVLGGNNSSEVRVWLNGARNKEPYPRIGDIVGELEPARRAHYGPDNVAEIYEDGRRLALVRAEKGITLFLEHRANGVEMEGGRIRAVIAQHTISGRRIRCVVSWVVDATGDGCVGALAGADHEMTPTGHMGRCNLWNVVDTGRPVSFPRCPWALDLAEKPFPGRARSLPGAPGDSRGIQGLGGWYWESGFDHDPIEDGESIRDWNFRAMYGAWDTLKNIDKVYPNHRLAWAAYVAGKRESRRILGDVVLTKEDVLGGKAHPDGCVPTGWPIDLHLPDPRYEKGFEGDAFISEAHYARYEPPYWIPYRCLYSRNVPNLFMAGRDISVTHEALGTVRVMRTCGCMGEVVGMAASLCKRYATDPRGVYRHHLEALKALMTAGAGKPLAPVSALGNVGKNVARTAEVIVSGSRDAEGSPPAFIVDGRCDRRRNDLRWLSKPGVPNWIELRWAEPRRIAAARVVSGYHHEGMVSDPILAFVLLTFDGTAWREIPGTRIQGNRESDWHRRFDPVTASRVRLLVEETGLDISRIWEVELYEPE